MVCNLLLIPRKIHAKFSAHLECTLFYRNHSVMCLCMLAICVPNIYIYIYIYKYMFDIKFIRNFRPIPFNVI